MFADYFKEYRNNWIHEAEILEPEFKSTIDLLAETNGIESGFSIRRDGSYYKITRELEHFSAYKKTRQSRSPDNVWNIESLAHWIRTYEPWKEAIEEYRSCNNTARKVWLKSLLPSFSGSVEILGNKGRKDLRDGEYVHSYLIQCDFDKHPNPSALRGRLRIDPHMRLIFGSPTEQIKAYIKVSEIKTKVEHTAAFEYVVRYCRHRDYGEIDQSCKDLSRVCLISHDPDVILKPAEPLPWTYLDPPKHKIGSKKKVFNTEYTGDSISLGQFLEKYDIDIISEAPYGSGTMYFITCPWKHEHGDGTIYSETSIFPHIDNSKWSFKCVHNHCAHRGWQDFRNYVAPKNNLIKS